MYRGLDCQAFYITYLNLNFNLQHLVFGGEKVKVKYANFDEELMQPPQFNTPPTVIQQQHQP